MSGRQELNIRLSDFQIQILTDGLKKMRENERYDPVTKKELKNILNAVERAVQKSKEQS